MSAFPADRHRDHHGGHLVLYAGQTDPVEGDTKRSVQHLGEGNLVPRFDGDRGLGRVGGRTSREHLHVADRVGAHRQEDGEVVVRRCLDGAPGCRQTATLGE